MLRSMKKASIFPSRNLRFIRLRIDEYSKRGCVKMLTQPRFLIYYYGAINILCK